MMKNLIPFLMLPLALFAEEPAAKGPGAEKVESLDVARISEAFGHLIGKNIESIGFKLDIAQVVKGLQDSTSGKNSPMTEKECVEAITAVQEAAFKAESQQNLRKAEEFLSNNKNEKGIVSVENDKLQYRVDKEGTGLVVEEHSSPLIRYAGKFLDGKTFDSSKEDEMIFLDETIAGFSKGILGMREGEKRVLFIHPDLAYGTSGYLPPNSLITFEVEVVKANAPQTEPIDSLSHAHPKGNPEIATPLDEQKVVR